MYNRNKHNRQSFKDFVKENPIGLFFLVAGIWWSIIYILAANQYDSQAIVAIYPDQDNAKNYSLEAEVENDKKIINPFSIESNYSIDRFSWPNGGYGSFDDCIVKDLSQMTVCTTKSGDHYGVSLIRFKDDESSH